MSRRDLYVPFEEKDEAKLLGARWDMRARRWYVSDGVSNEPFVRWFEPRAERSPTPPDYINLALNVVIQRPVIAEAKVTCWACHRDTPVITVAGRDAEGDLVSVTGIQAFDSKLANALVRHPCYRLAFSRTTQAWAFSNVCVSCGALQGDFFLHSEPDGPFFALHSPENQSHVTDLVGPISVATDLEPYGELD